LEPKGHFYIGARGGLVDEQHYRRMGDAIWLFLWLVLRQTQTNSEGEGVVYYGNPITYEAVERDTGFPERTLRRWLGTLRQEKYIRTAASSRGLSVWILNAKKRNKVEAWSAKCGRGGRPNVAGVVGHIWPTILPQVSANEHVADFNTILNASLNTTKMRPRGGAVFSQGVFKQIPRPKTAREIDERRRFLLGQRDAILRAAGRAAQ
jgi:hypothetical protein